MIKKIFLFIFVCLSLCHAQYTAVPIDNDVQLYLSPKKPIAGHCAIIKFYNLDINKQYHLKLYSSQEWDYPIYEIDKFTSFLIGIPIEAKHKIKYKFYENQKLLKTGYIKITNIQYPKSYITVNNKFFKMNKKTLQRIRREQKTLQKARSIFTAIRFWGNVMKPPVVIDKISSQFGSIRIFNKKNKSIHRGVDLPKPVGTSVHSIFPGRVVEIGNFFYGGKTVFIDHGLGVISTYAHLSKILVKKNDLVYAGEIIGEVGMTGRSTGPHLHWGIYINQVPIDPISFMSNIKKY